MSNESGTLVVGSVTRYLPYGGYRTAPSANLTDHGFTGHPCLPQGKCKHNDELGLIYMQARYYVPGLGRFASADTLVPEPGDPQLFNRYSYVAGNPLKYRDPTGHALACGFSGEACEGEPPPEPPEYPPWAYPLATINSFGDPDHRQFLLDYYRLYQDEFEQAFEGVGKALEYVDTMDDAVAVIYEWTRGIPGFDVIPKSWLLSAASQALVDLDEPICPMERGARVILVVAEGYAIDAISVNGVVPVATYVFEKTLPLGASVSVWIPPLAMIGAASVWFFGWQIGGDAAFKWINEEYVFPAFHEAFEPN